MWQFAAAAGVAERAMAAFGRGDVHIETGWLSGEALAVVRGASSSLLMQHGAAGGVGVDAGTGAARLDIKARRCLTVDLLTHDALATLVRTHPALVSVLRQLDDLRAELVKLGRPLVSDAEVQLLRYDVGGHYKRHVDDGAGMAQLPVCRSVSLVLYLTPDDWSDADGGKLRVFLPPEDSHGNSGRGHAPERYLDIPPAAGTLLLFESATVPHAVLPTHRERIGCVGWFLTRRERAYEVHRR
jgi:hypothetical protein